MNNLNLAVHRISENNQELLIGYLKENEFKVYILDGQHINNKHNFFQETIKVLPQDPHLSGRINLDAFVDSIWGGMDEAGFDRVAIIWEKSNNIIDKSPKDLNIITQCFEELSESFKTTEYGLDKPIVLRVFLMGKGESFNEVLEEYI